MDKLTNREINYKKTFRSDSGIQVLEDLKKSLKYGETIYSAGMSDKDLAFEIGRQSVINDIMFTLSRPDKK